MIDLSDRKDCFYWQTDRKLSPQDFEKYFLKRHEVSTEELKTLLTRGIDFVHLNTVEIIAPDQHVLKGSVNIVRRVVINGKQYIVRIHPKGIKNGYFFAEKTILDVAKNNGLPVPEIVQVHESKGEDDMDFVVMLQAKGENMDVYLHDNPQLEEQLLFAAGVQMGKLHNIQVDGFGSFDNQIAKNEGRLIGLKISNTEFITTALEENLQRLVDLGVSSTQEMEHMQGIMAKYTFEPKNGSRLLHNDFADWNLLTNGKEITGILDWDESCGGDPVADLACWSTFFNPKRYDHFYKGYLSIQEIPNDYELRFHYYRLRYGISKMALRAKRYLVDKSDFVKERIVVGKQALADELVWFGKNV